MNGRLKVLTKVEIGDKLGGSRTETLEELEIPPLSSWNVNEGGNQSLNFSLNHFSPGEQLAGFSICCLHFFNFFFFNQNSYANEDTFFGKKNYADFRRSS